MEFLYLCGSFPLEFLCTQTEIMPREWAGAFYAILMQVNSASCRSKQRLANRHLLASSRITLGVITLGVSHDGRRDGGARGRLLRFIDRVCLRLRTVVRRSSHDF
jgi:hypothetical protein